MAEKYSYEDKIWGRVRHIFSSKHSAVSHLQVKAGFRCSRHYHHERENLFAVLSGEIEVTEYHDDDVQIVTRLREGDIHEVEAGVLHQFRVVEDGEVIEVYSPAWPDAIVQINDIVRLDEGGPV